VIPRKPNLSGLLLLLPLWQVCRSWRRLLRSVEVSGHSLESGSARPDSPPLLATPIIPSSFSKPHATLFKSQ
jgi:hypothetical protein